MNPASDLSCVARVVAGLAALSPFTTGCGGNSHGGAAVGGAGSGAACTSDSAAHLRECVSRDRLMADLTQIAQPRSPGSAGWQAAQDLCASRLASLGFTVERQNYGTGTNVIGTLRRGSGARLLVSAHYDGVQNCTAADDNGTGFAGVLEAARVLSAAPFSGELVVACWDEEELGCVGSRAYVTRAVAQSETITEAVVFDLIGYFKTDPNSQQVPTGFETYFPSQAAQLAADQYRADFITVVSDDLSTSVAQDFVTHATAIGLASIEIAIPAALKNTSLVNTLGRSDHSSFWTQNYPALFVTDTAEYRNPHYHCTNGPDAVADIDAQSYTRVVQATVGAVASKFGL